MTKLGRFITLMIVPLLAACGSGQSSPKESEKSSLREISIRHAKLIRMEESDQGLRVTIKNPWDTTKILSRYLLVEDEKRVNEKGTVTIQIPLRRSVLFSGVHASLLSELGIDSEILGICDTQYLHDTILGKRIREGLIKDCGSSMQPIVEKILSLKPDGIILSPYEDGSGGATLRTSGIPLVMAADYMESTPLGRAEWMRFYGRLFGVGDKADSLFAQTEKEYIKTRNEAHAAAKGDGQPRILFDRIYGHEWSVPTSGSVMGIMIKDAGGSNPFELLGQRGSAQLSPERVLHSGSSADIWLIRYNQAQELTLQEMSKENEAYTRIKAFRNGDVYGSDTMETNIFEDGAFHPQRILAEMAYLFHPTRMKEPEQRYYHKLK